MRAILISVGFSLMLCIGSFAQQTATAPAAIVRASNFYRTELYFGRSIPGGGLVGDEQWESFLSDVVTPLFPDGFTVIAGRGQYRESSGKIAKEPSHVLVFLYRKAERKTAGMKIEKIRSEYKTRFAQESVMRVDFRKSVMVSF